MNLDKNEILDIDKQWYESDSTGDIRLIREFNKKGKEK